MNVIHRRWYVIKPKERNCKAYALMPYSSQLRTDYMHLAAITYQAFGLDTKKNTQISLCVFFVLAPFYFPGQLPAKYLRR